MDGGSQSPRRPGCDSGTSMRAFPRPRTQIHVTDGFADAFLDMGWEEPMVGVDYDGEQHRSSRTRYVHDIGRNELVDARAGSTYTSLPNIRGDSSSRGRLTRSSAEGIR